MMCQYTGPLVTVKEDVRKKVQVMLNAGILTIQRIVLGKTFGRLLRRDYFGKIEWMLRGEDEDCWIVCEQELNTEVLKQVTDIGK